jgi:hypothetical protein
LLVQLWVHILMMAFVMVVMSAIILTPREPRMRPLLPRHASLPSPEAGTSSVSACSRRAEPLPAGRFLTSTTRVLLTPQ